MSSINFINSPYSIGTHINLIVLDNKEPCIKAGQKVESIFQNSASIISVFLSRCSKFLPHNKTMYIQYPHFNSASFKVEKTSLSLKPFYQFDALLSIWCIFISLMRFYQFDVFLSVWCVVISLVHCYQFDALLSGEQ